MIKIAITFCLTAMVLINGCISSTETRISQIKAQYPQWDQSTVDNVAKRQVKVGMTEEMVLEAMGKPWEISQEGDVVVWAYGYNACCRG